MKPDTQTWALMQRFIKNEELTPDNFSVFSGVAVGDMEIPNRNMKLSPELLGVMAEDAQKGVSFMVNHNWSSFGVQGIPIGKVFHSRLGQGTQEGETVSLNLTQYILKGDDLVDGYSRNAIIDLIDSGVMSDTSIGWQTDRDSYKCSICGNSIFDWRKCEHIPGRMYPKSEEEGAPTIKCIILAMPPKKLSEGNNCLIENSIVFDGAYPKANVQSITGEILETPSGNFEILDPVSETFKENASDIICYSTPKDIMIMSKRSDHKKIFAKGEYELDKDKEKMDVGEETETKTEKQDSTSDMDHQKESTEEVQTQEIDNGDKFTRMTLPELNKFFEAIDEMLSNKPNGDKLLSVFKDGVQYRKDSVEAALKSGVRALGNKFNPELWTKNFAQMDIESIQATAQHWEQEASEKFGGDLVYEIPNQEKNTQKIKGDLSKLKTTKY